MPENVLPLITSVPWLLMAPPPFWPLFASPLLSTTESSVRWPADATSKMRNTGVPVAVERSMVAPLPVMVTLPVITGSAVPPSVALLAAVRLNVQPLGSVTVAAVVALLAVVIAAIRLELEQVIAAA